MITILGKIDITSPVIKSKSIYCDDCGLPVSGSCGDPRHKIITTFHDGSQEIRMICDMCERDQWGDNECITIFDQTPDHMR